MGETAILIVEDEAIVARDLRQRLRDMGYTVVGMASRGEEAVQKAETLHPDLVLMDIHLASEMDGIQASETIRAHLDVPVIFLTACADENSRCSRWMRKTMKETRLNCPTPILPTLKRNPSKEKSRTGFKEC